MSVREQQVNDALHALDETHRLGQIGRDEYRRRRRQVLESLRDAAACSRTDTVRRVVPAAEAPPASMKVHRHAACRPEIDPSRGRQFGARLATMCVMVLAIVAGAAAVCWFLTAV